jgi:hypothetical protein
MITAMFLAHLVGDYILQWDALARWKSREYKGAFIHGLIVLLVAWLFALPFNPAWWPWVLFLGLSHIAIDMAEVPLRRKFDGRGNAALHLFMVDQVLHLSLIVFALAASGYLAMPSLIADMLAALEDNRLLTFALGYAFVTLPAWIVVEFAVFGLIKGSPPDFTQATNKYVGSLERGLITTFVLLGQFILVPLVALPRLIFEGPQVIGSQRATLYVAELLASVSLAIVIGLMLRQL